MRPRVFPAEDMDERAQRLLREVASMRPRVFPAEDASDRRPSGAVGVASMRPRVFPAEDSGPAFDKHGCRTLQ